MVNRPERSEPQQFRQTIGIDPIALVAGLAATANVAHDHSLDMRREYAVQPLGLRSLLEGDVHGPRPRTRPTIALASVATVARITAAPSSSRTLATTVA